MLHHYLVKAIPASGSRLRTRRRTMGIGAVLALLYVATGAGAATITVNSVADNTIAGDLQCTLREALANVDAAADVTSGDCIPGTGSGDTIVFTLALPATIVLTTDTELEISRDVILSGPSDPSSGTTLAVDGNAHGTRVFDVTAGTVDMENVTIQNGGQFCDGQSCMGGSGLLVAANASVTLSNCTLNGNEASAAGGAIFNSGSVTLNNCSLSSNGTGDWYYTDGGAIGNAGTMILTDCQLIDNGTSDESSGGAIENSGTMTLTGCFLNGNATGEDGDGGAIDNAGTMTVASCTFSDNWAGQFAAGGAIANENDGTMAVTNCTFSNNAADAGGGAIANGGTLALSNSTLSGNSSYEGGGGAFGNWSTATLTNCTLSGNSTDDDNGGAVGNYGTVTLTNCTVSGNSNGNGAGSGGAIYTEPTGTTTLTNTILAFNVVSGEGCAASSCPENCDGAPIVDGGHNLSSDATCLSVTDPLLLTDPNLAPLGFYGGPTNTMALCTGIGAPDPTCTGRSAAIDAGDDAVTAPPLNLATDQRGMPRWSGAHVDIGAYEVQVQPPSSCVGDCDGSGAVTVNDLLIMVRIAILGTELALCPAGDANQDGAITIDEILTAVNNALNGCPQPPNGAYLCSGGPDDGQPCNEYEDENCGSNGVCVTAQGVCDGGASDGAYCDCAGGTCGASPASSDATSTGTCQGGPNAGGPCQPVTNCANASCVGTQMVCLGGSHKGLACLRDAQCPGSECQSTGKLCEGGDFNGSACVDDADCSNADGSPGGSCMSSGIGLSCVASDGCLEGFCTDGVCCSSDGCPWPERCDVPGFEGTCNLPRCTQNADCPQGSVCLYDAAHGFFACIAPTATPTPSRTPTPTPTQLSPGAYCWATSQCPGALVCGTEGVCCNQQTCPQGESCTIPGHLGFCTAIPTPLPTPASALLCSGGTNDGNACQADTDCQSGVCVVAQGVCDGGPDDGASCGCVAGTCVPATPTCDPTLTGTCQGGATTNACCDVTRNCSGSAGCVGSPKVCLSGASSGVACLRDDQCPGSACVSTGRSCTLGARSGHPCVTDSDCTDANGFHSGACTQQTPTPTPTQLSPGDYCWETAQCPFGFSCTDERVCCSQSSCPAGQSCAVPGSRGACTVVPTPTPTASSARLCSGGWRDGRACTSDSDCSLGGGVCVIVQGVCAGGPDDGKYCDCPAGSCAASTSTCDAAFSGVCQGGAKDSQCCQVASNCAGGNPCIGTQQVCLAGSDKGIACLSAAQCGQYGWCVSTGSHCTGGAFDGFACVDDGDCPKQGTCTGSTSPTPTLTAIPSATPIPGLTPQPLGHVCATTAECILGACVDGVCCSQDSCPASQYCNVSSSPGTCAPLGHVGTQCKYDTDCATRNCSPSLTCGPQRTPTPLGGGAACSSTSQCAPGLVCSSDEGVCCTSLRCASGFSCENSSGNCTIIPTPTQTPGGVGAQCGSNVCQTGLFCTDGVCCATASCTTPERCDIFGLQGKCNQPLDAGVQCWVNTDCNADFGLTCAFCSSGPPDCAVAGLYFCAIAQPTWTPVPQVGTPTPTNTLTGTPTPNGEFLCSAGPRDGLACNSDTDCAPTGVCVIAQGVCDGGSDDGLPCDCAAGTCTESTPACDPTYTGVCVGGPSDTFCCDTTTNCSDSAACIGSQKVCVGGTYAGYSCLNDGQCPGSLCRSTGKYCSGGDYDSYACVDNNDCTNTSDGTTGVCTGAAVLPTPTPAPTLPPCVHGTPLPDVPCEASCHTNCRLAGVRGICHVTAGACICDTAGATPIATPLCEP